MLKISLLMMAMSLMFMATNHPLSMALILMVMTLMASMMTGTLNLSFWYSYMLFMIMIGGMLVLIMYMTTLASNEPTETMTKYIIMLAPIMVIILIPDNMLTYPMNNSMETTQFMSQLKSLSLSKYITFTHLPIFIMLINYLYITLIAIVKITNMKYGSLRQKF